MPSVVKAGKGILFTFEVMGEKQVSAFLSGLAKRVKDFRPVWDEIEVILRKSTQSVFASEGRGGQFKWPPLKPSTILDRIRQGYSPTPMLVRSGRMKRGITQQGGEHIFNKRKLEMDFGTSVPYLIFHQMSREINPGKGKLPRRAVVVIDKKDVSQIIQVIRKAFDKEYQKAQMMKG